MTIISTGAYDLPASADRNRNAMILAKGTGPLDVVDGVHSGMGIIKTSGMGFAITPGRAAVNGATAADGTFTCAITAQEVGVFADGDATRDRIDLVVLQSYPNNSSATGVKVEVITGAVPNTGEPQIPATPAGALELFEVRISAGQSAGNGGWTTSKATDRRRPIGTLEFVDYTPTWSGFATLGTSPVRQGRYRIDGDKATLNIKLVAGAGASMGTANFLTFDLPVAPQLGWRYYGSGSLHTNGLGYDLRVYTSGSTGYIWAVDPSNGVLIQPGRRAYPFTGGSEIYATLEYIIDLP